MRDLRKAYSLASDSYRYVSAFQLAVPGKFILL
jgi:hypothetical protein